MFDPLMKCFGHRLRGCPHMWETFCFSTVLSTLKTNKNHKKPDHTIKIVLWWCRYEEKYVAVKMALPLWVYLHTLWSAKCYSIFVGSEINEYGDSRTIERGIYLNVQVTCRSGEVSKTIHRRKSGCSQFAICSTIYDHQTACHLTKYNSSIIIKSSNFFFQMSCIQPKFIRKNEKFRYF